MYEEKPYLYKKHQDLLDNFPMCNTVWARGTLTGEEIKMWPEGRENVWIQVHVCVQLGNNETK